MKQICELKILFHDEVNFQVITRQKRVRARLGECKYVRLSAEKSRNIYVIAACNK